MSNINEFKKLVKSLPQGHQTRLAEKIRGVCNRDEHTEFLKAIALGAYLSLSDEISLLGYVTVPDDISRDKTYCTAIKDEVHNSMIVGNDEIERNMSFENFMKKILYA